MYKIWILISKGQRVICIFSEVEQSCVLYRVELSIFWIKLRDVSHLLCYLQWMCLCAAFQITLSHVHFTTELLWHLYLGRSCVLQSRCIHVGVVLDQTLTSTFRQLAIMFESYVASTMYLAYCNYRKEV
jgi:hypothetical protein